MSFLNFIDECLHWDPLKRITPELALKHPFITGERYIPPTVEKFDVEQSPLSTFEYMKQHNNSLSHQTTSKKLARPQETLSIQNSEKSSLIKPSHLNPKYHRQSLSGSAFQDKKGYLPSVRINSQVKTIIPSKYSSPRKIGGNFVGTSIYINDDSLPPLTDHPNNYQAIPQKTSNFKSLKNRSYLNDSRNDRAGLVGGVHIGKRWNSSSEILGAADAVLSVIIFLLIFSSPNGVELLLLSC